MINGITIYSIYVEGHTGPHAELIERLAQDPQKPGTILLGDFNMHHPMWDQHDRMSRNADTLLELAAR